MTNDHTSKARETKMNWFRLYHDWLSDSKVLALSDKNQLFLIKIWCVSSRETIRGTLPNIDVVAKATATTKGKCEAMIRDLIEAGFIDEDASTKALTVHGWSERQYESDDVTARTRRHKENQKERSRNVPGNGKGTVSDNRVQRQKQIQIQKEDKTTQDDEPDYPDPETSFLMVHPGGADTTEAEARSIWSALWAQWRKPSLCQEFYQHQRWYTAAVWRAAIRKAVIQGKAIHRISYVETIAEEYSAKGIPAEAAPKHGESGYVPPSQTVPSQYYQSPWLPAEVA